MIPRRTPSLSPVPALAIVLVVYAVAQACDWSEIFGGLIAWGALVIFVTRSLIVQALRGWLRQVIARRARGWTPRRMIARWFPRAWASNG